MHTHRHSHQMRHAWHAHTYRHTHWTGYPCSPAVSSIVCVRTLFILLLCFHVSEYLLTFSLTARMWSIIALHAICFSVVPTIGEKGGWQTVERQEGDREDWRFCLVFWLCIFATVLEVSLYKFSRAVTFSLHWCSRRHAWSASPYPLVYTVSCWMCAFFCIIQVIAGMCESFHVQYAYMCMWIPAHCRGLVIRASLHRPINYDGLLMMCNGMIY